MLDPERARRLAGLALQASRADETEVVVTLEDQELNRFTHEHPVQNVRRLTGRVSVRVRIDGRQGKATTGTLEAAAVLRTVERALAAARLAPRPDEPLPALPERGPDRLRGARPGDGDPVATARAVGEMTARVRAAGCAAAGIHAGLSTLRLAANSRGLDVCDTDTKAEVSLSVFREDGAGWANRIAPTRDELPCGEVAERAVAKAVASRGARAVPPGDYTVVLEPAAVSSLLLFTAAAGFGAQQVADGTSFLSGRLGEPVLGENISIMDDCWHPLALGPVFDGEGRARERVSLVERGVARGVVHDALTARRFGCASTGHARPQPCPDGPAPENLVLEPGTASREELIAGVRRGLLVTQFHYSNIVEPTRLTLTGMTRNGTFLVEDGEVVGAVRNLRYTMSLVEALGRVSALGRDATLSSALFGGHVVVPSLRIEGFRFSSGTEF